MENANALERMNKAVLKLLSSYSLENLSRVIVSETNRLAGTKYGALYLYRNEKIEEAYASSDKLFLKRRKGGILEKAIDGKKTIIWQKSQIKQNHPRLRALGINSVVIIPLHHGNSAIGVLVFYSMKPNYFNYEELHILKLYASMASMAITKTQLYEETERALELRDRFISLASHELRTPLTSMNGYIQLLYKKLAKKDTVESRWMEELYRENVRFTNLVKDLLDINRIKQGQLAFVLQEVNIKQIIEAVLKKFSLSHPERAITLLDKNPNDNYLIIGDFEKLAEMTSALIGNAIKFSSMQSTILFTLTRLDRTIRIFLKDQGKGIPQKDLTRIFEGFYKTKYGGEKEGMGVGLFFAKHIILLHRGKMHITSKEGEGTTVEILLPAAKI